MRTVSDYNELCRSHLDEDLEVLFAAKSPPTDAQIDQFCREIDCSLPQDFRCFIGSYLDGLYVGASERAWPDRKGGAAWMFQRGLYVYGLDGGLPDWISLRHQTPKFRAASRSSLTPCLKIVSDPDFYCFSSAGELLRWSHETFVAKPVGSDFFTLLNESMATLRKYKDRAKKELLPTK
ncbi:MAG TPA: SMI1/KNR4 family protein [Candidatus Didemnitutus sp.]|nr:SMI1/KNR4 family protein [Candidatus Didemnitutus sp.]